MALQSLPPSATEYATAQRLEAGAAISSVLRSWRRMTGDFDASWATVGPRILAAMDLAQERITTGALAYVPTVIEDTGQRLYAPAYDVEPTALVGTAGSGVPSEVLAYSAVVHAKTAVEAGMTPAQALAQGGTYLSMATGTLLSDTGRTAEKMAGHARRVTWYVRMLVPPSCGRCVILAGKETTARTAFLRHPGCFPAGAVVSGPAPEAATRRWYEGELAIVRTASGKELTATGNHPVLTDQGWIPAGLLKVGDHVLSSTLPKGAVPLVVPDEQQAPARIEDVWGADSMVPLGQMPTATEDFHGDGGHGKVDVVLPDRLLHHGHESAAHEGIVEELLAVGVGQSARLPGLRASEQLLHGLLRSTDSIVRSGSLGEALVGGHPGRAIGASLGSAADLRAVFGQALSQGVPAHAEAPAEAVLALSSLVGGHDLGIGKHEVSPRWDAPAGPLTMESRVAYASRGQDLAHRLSGQVASDRVVKVERVQWSGHVYNLTSAEGWYSANGFIVSNCDCRNIPQIESLDTDLAVNAAEYLESLDDAGLAKTLGSKANVQAFKEGADLNQLINAYRRKGAVSTAQQYGRAVKYTTEGTTRRGLAYRAMSQMRANRDTDTRPSGQRYFHTRTRRLMPESVYQIAKDPADARRLLRLYGWIL